MKTRTEIAKEYKRLRDFNQREPNAASCDVRWKDSGEVKQDYIITFFPTAGMSIDDYIFFNADGIHGFLGLLDDNNGEDFEIVSVNELIWV